MAWGKRPVIELVGRTRGLAEIAEWEREARLAFSQATIQEAEYELPMTQELVPVRSGKLKATGRVEKMPSTPDLVLAAIVYGDETVDYALPVHEDLQAYHENGQAKYVEEVVRREMSGFRGGDAADRMAHTFATLMKKYEKTGRMVTSVGSVMPQRGRPRATVQG